MRRNYRVTVRRICAAVALVMVTAGGIPALAPAPAALASPAVTVRGERLGPLPLLAHFLERLGLPALLERFVPAPPRRGMVTPAKSLGVLLRSFLVEREPIYR